MDTKILIKNQGAGSETREFPSERHHELTVGRDASCDLRFNPDDDLVSRRHARIVEVAGAEGRYTIADLGSRNGTYVNRQRIFEPVALNCGDRVQLGPGGPEFEFDLEPRPASASKPTRLAGSLDLAPACATREALPPTPVPAGVGKATVERLIGEGRRQQRKTLSFVVGGLLALIMMVAGGLYLTRPKLVQTVEKRLAPDGWTPTQIAAANTDATVEFEVGWKLVDMESGKQLFHLVIPNQKPVRDKNGKVVKDSRGRPKVEPIAPGSDKFLPVFRYMPGDGKLEPILSTSDVGEGGARNFPIGGELLGSGFVVSSDGFILTNRHVASAWMAPYGFSNERQAQVQYGGVFIKESGEIRPLAFQSFPNWIPAQARIVLEGNGVDPMQTQTVVGKKLEGRNDYMDIAFARNRIRVPAKISRVSDRVDVAMVKIEIPQTLKKVELNDNYDTMKVGDPVVCLGYPGVSYGLGAPVDVVASKDVLNPRASQKLVADPTLSSGNIARITRGQVVSGEGEYFGGDFLQLTINSTGHGNSGGPVFDAQGRVIGIFSLGWADLSGGVTSVTAAIPIRYGMELMGVHSASR